MGFFVRSIRTQITHSPELLLCKFTLWFKGPPCQQCWPLALSHDSPSGPPPKQTIQCSRMPVTGGTAEHSFLVMTVVCFSKHYGGHGSNKLKDRDKGARCRGHVLRANTVHFPVSAPPRATPGEDSMSQIMALARATPQFDTLLFTPDSNKATHGP
jgi:hypothetical protein